MDEDDMDEDYAAERFGSAPYRHSITENRMDLFSDRISQQQDPRLQQLRILEDTLKEQNKLEKQRSSAYNIDTQKRKLITELEKNISSIDNVLIEISRIVPDVSIVKLKNYKSKIEVLQSEWGYNLLDKELRTNISQKIDELNDVINYYDNKEAEDFGKMLEGAGKTKKKRGGKIKKKRGGKTKKKRGGKTKKKRGGKTKKKRGGKTKKKLSKK